MAIWEKSRMEIAFSDRSRPHENGACEVTIDDTLIVVAYNHESRSVTYEGENKGTGHFMLSCPEIDGKASLHIVKDGEVLEGYWVMAGEKGYWKIRLQS